MKQYKVSRYQLQVFYVLLAIFFCLITGVGMTVFTSLRWQSEVASARHHEGWKTVHGYIYREIKGDFYTDSKTSEARYFQVGFHNYYGYPVRATVSALTTDTKVHTWIPVYVNNEHRRPYFPTTLDNSDDDPYIATHKLYPAVILVLGTSVIWLIIGGIAALAFDCHSDFLNVHFENREDQRRTSYYHLTLPSFGRRESLFGMKAVQQKRTKLVHNRDGSLTEKEYYV